VRPANCYAVSCATKLPNFKSACDVAGQLLDELGVSAEIVGEADHPALAWQRAGLFPLCGESCGEALMPPIPLAASVDGAMLALKALADDPIKLPPSGTLLLGERSRLMKLQRAGRSSPGGHCRLLDTVDGRIAINLARDEDWELLEAWLGKPVTLWEDIEGLVKTKDASDLIEQGIELGLPVALDAIEKVGPWRQETLTGSGSHHRNEVPLVVDLSSLWAGPLVGNLLHLLGAEVVKVESLSRPDGARRGNSDFHNLMNAGKKSVAFDFSSERGREDLKKLIASADIVIEASRPRALRQLGIDAEKVVSETPGKIWVRLMAYGDNENRIGFGDDIGVSAGLCTIMERAWGLQNLA